MSEGKEGDNKPVDVKEDTVKREDYNKIVESHNSLKAEKEKLENDMKAKNESDQKAVWEKEKADLIKQNEDLKKIAEEKKDAKVSKGIVQDQKKDAPQEVGDIKKMLDEKLPDREKNPEKFGSAIARYGHYKSATTKKYDDEQLGMALSLHANAQHVNPEIVRGAKDNLPGTANIVLNKK